MSSVRLPCDHSPPGPHLMHSHRTAADTTMRGRIAQLNGKLVKLERQMQLIEATLESVDQEAADGGE